MKAPCYNTLALMMVVGMASAAATHAASLGPGESATLEPGGVFERWSLNGATLKLAPGSVANSVTGSNGATVLIDSGTINGSWGVGLYLSGGGAASSAFLKNATITDVFGLGAQDGSLLQLESSRVVGHGADALFVSSGHVAAAETSFVGASNGINAFSGKTSISLEKSSSVVGEAHAAAFNSGALDTGDHLLIVDASHLESRTGSLLRISNDAAHPAGTVARIELNNGSTAAAGDGVLLETDGVVNAILNISGSSIDGNVINDKAGGATAVIGLRDNAVFTGAMTEVTGVSVVSARWNVAHDSSADVLQVSTGGVVAFAPPVGGAHRTLTVGSFSGDDGLIVFNTALGDDASASDKLVVTGDTTGSADVRVNNIGGSGAQTADGIELIRVVGASNGVFNLAGRAIGGSYEYFLHKGAGVAGTEGNWYLRSELPGAPSPCDPAAPVAGCTPIVVPGDPDPISPVDPGPLLRPEGGAYLANQSAAVNMFAHRLSDRTDAMDGDEGRNAWARVGRQQSDFSAVGGQLSVNGSTSVVQIGSDLLRRGDVVLGVMLGSGRAESSVVSQLTDYGAKGSVRGTALGAYGTWLQNGSGDEGAYLDANLQVGRFENRVQGVGLARENYDAQMARASLESGYNFNVWQGATSALYLQPQLQLSYVDFQSDRHVESNGTVVDGSDAGGLSGRVGVRAFGRSRAAGNMAQPYMGVNWLRSSGTSTLDFNGQTLGADMPRNRYEVQAGAELKLGQHWGGWGGITVQRGDHGYRNVGGQVGMRMAW